MFCLPHSTASVVLTLRCSVSFHSTARMASLVPKTSSVSQRLEKRSRLSPGARIDVALENNSVSAPQLRDFSPKRKKRKVKQTIEPYSSDDVLHRDVLHLLKQTGKSINPEDEWNPPLKTGIEIEVTVSELSSTGDSIAVLSTSQPWAVVVPFALPGERIRARIFRHGPLVSFADLLSIESPNLGLRDTNRVRCKYFGKCAGCQYQMISYETQLEFKREIVDKAYQNFSELPSHLVPEALPTIPSPQEYKYRTKITPHFDVPRRKRKSEKIGSKDFEVRIGFSEKGRQSVMDIEECPIATPILNQSLELVRQDVRERFHTFKRGATLLLRDSLVSSSDEKIDTAGTSEALGKHVCITNHHDVVRERVGNFFFEFPAGSFFQNNNSILESLTSYVREAVLTESNILPTHLVDAYCGSGLFSITLSPHFARVAGVEISNESVQYARHNAELNRVPPSKCTFHTGKAEAIFDSVKDFPPHETVVVVDPPRKGCDIAFLDQLVAFGPATVVYISCNVHTQARDVGFIVKRIENKYRLKSLRGFDLFPQTAHVESVAVLCMS